MPGRKAIILSLATLASAYLAFSFLILPGIAHARLKAALDKAGFDTSFLKRPQAGFDFILYRDVTLDKDDISSIRAIRAIYNPLTLAVGGDFTTLELYSLILSGEWEETGVNFSGLSLGNIFAAAAGPFQRLSLKNASISLLTRDMGGISVTFDLEGTRDREKLTFQGQAQSRQPALAFDAPFKGALETSIFSMDANLERIKFESPAGDFKLARGNGKISASWASNEPLKANLELQAGGAQIRNVPWHNLNLSGLYDGAWNLSATAAAMKIKSPPLKATIAFKDGKMALENKAP